MVDNKGPTPQFLSSLNAALAYFKRLEATGNIAQMDRERQNINLVIELGLSRPETRIPALEALVGSFQLLYARGYWREGMETFEKALKVCPEDRPDLKIEMLGRYGELMRISGEFSASVAAHEAELALAQELDDPLLIGMAHYRLGSTFREMLQFDAAEQHCQAALSVLKQTGDNGFPTIANALNSLGRIARLQGNMEQAFDYLGRAVAIQRQRENDFYVALSLHDLGTVYLDAGQFEEALSHYHEAEQLLEGTEHNLERILFQVDKGIIYFRKNDFAQAENEFREIDLDYLRQNGHLEQEARVLTNMGNSILYQQRYDEAAQLFQSAIRIWRHLELDLDLANAIGSLGEALAGKGDQAQAARHLQEALDILQSYMHIPRGKWLTDLFSKEMGKLDQK